MPILSSLYGRYRTPGGPDVDQAIGSSKDGNVLVGQGQSFYEELTRRGTMWSTISTSAVAALVVRPSTVASVEIFNGYPGGGPSLIVDRIFGFNLVATAVNSNAGLWAMVTSPKAACASTLTVSSHRGQLAYGGQVVVAVGTTVVTNGWFPWGSNYIAPSAAAPGGILEAQVTGRLIVPPQCSLCLHVVGSIVGDTYTEGASWYEKQLDS